MEKMTNNLQKELRLIQSVQRCCDIMECFNYDHQELSLAELSERIGININTCRGLVQTLAANGYMERNPNGTYSLGMIFIPKAELASSRQIERLTLLAEPLMLEVTRQLNVATMFQLVSGLHIFTIKSTYPKDSHYILTAKADTRFNCNATASGKLLLLHSSIEERKILLSQIDRKKYTEHTITKDVEILREIDRTAEKGYGTEFEEINDGVSSIAVPIIKNGTLFGTVSIVCLGSRIHIIEERAVRMLREIAEKISVGI